MGGSGSDSSLTSRLAPSRGFSMRLFPDHVQPSEWNTSPSGQRLDARVREVRLRASFRPVLDETGKITQNAAAIIGFCPGKLGVQSSVLRFPLQFSGFRSLSEKKSDQSSFFQHKRRRKAVPSRAGLCLIHIQLLRDRLSSRPLPDGPHSSSRVISMRKPEQRCQTQRRPSSTIPCLDLAWAIQPA